ncbi:hypothetical protein V7124_05125 [Neobacillus niacini]|uniref:hypothetical protein n=1 Tax=Neobacillus niacini TaxID=86668 RepID=UPI002FFE1765
MKKSEWSDKQLEELLRQMPLIQDHRNPRDIYQNLSIKKRKRPAWVVPGFAAVAAVLLLFLFIPRLLTGTEYSFDSAKQEQSTSEEKISLSDDKNSSILMKEEDSAEIENGKSGAAPKMLADESSKTALYDNEIENGIVMTYWVPDSQVQMLVPISTVITPDTSKDWLTIFTETMGLLKEEEWGLTDYYPLNATFTWDSNTNTVTVDVPIDHKYGQGSTAETIFITSLNNNIASNSQVNKIKFTTNGQPGIELGNQGVIKEMKVEPVGNHAYFSYTPDGMDTAYLVPSTEKYQDINSAFEIMKTDQQELGLTATIGSDFPIKDVTIKENKLLISMDENSKMENNLATVFSFEAILLTAKEFGIETITIVNPPIQLLGPFDLSKEVKVPLAANLRTIK